MKNSFSFFPFQFIDSMRSCFIKISNHSLSNVCLVLGSVLGTLNYNYLKSLQQSISIVTSVLNLSRLRDLVKYV